jgi:hypothetical protein
MKDATMDVRWGIERYEKNDVIRIKKKIYLS